MADAYATAFMVLGLDEAKQVLDVHPVLRVFFIYQEGDTLKHYSTID
jgi:thiamine biosynthesis lipoprotein